MFKIFKIKTTFRKPILFLSWNGKDMRKFQPSRHNNRTES